MSSETHRAIEAVWRVESARLIAGLARYVRDVALAEGLAADALVAAIEQWPGAGIPNKPRAWLMTASKRKAIDLFRTHKLLERRHLALGHEVEPRQESAAADLDASLDDDVGDDLASVLKVIA